jgi:hypothetical protein
VKLPLNLISTVHVTCPLAETLAALLLGHLPFQSTLWSMYQLHCQQISC